MCGLLKALGVRVRRVADLDEGAIYVKESRLLLLDFNMTDEHIDRAMDDVLPVAFRP